MALMTMTMVAIVQERVTAPSMVGDPAWPDWILMTEPDAWPASRPVAARPSELFHEVAASRAGTPTFSNVMTVSGTGPTVPYGTTVLVTCKVFSSAMAAAFPDGYWYRVASPPWDNQYYAAANAFLNGDAFGGPYVHGTDYSVPDCVS